MAIRIKLVEEQEERKAVGVDMWYDPHFRHWVLYPVDAEGTQLKEAAYGFGKKEALQIKKDLEAEIASGNHDGWYY